MCFIIPGENVAFIFSELPLFLSIVDTTDSGVRMQVVDFETAAQWCFFRSERRRLQCASLFKFINSRMEHERVCCQFWHLCIVKTENVNVRYFKMKVIRMQHS